MGAGYAAMLAQPLRPTLGAEPLVARLIVPHPRNLKQGMSGPDVLALHRALAKAGFHAWKLRKVGFGATLDRDLRRYQQHLKLKADGVYGSVTHAHLAKHYDAFGINLILSYETPKQQARNALVAAAMTLYNMRALVHYTQGPARMFIVRHKIKTTKVLAMQRSVWEDCSSGVTGLYYMAGVPDPNGFGFNSLGYTGTLALHGRAVSRSAATVGTLAFYGRAYPYSHVGAVVARPGGNSLRIFSHGSENGPYLLDVDYRGDLRQLRSYPGF
jgi:hypothetical protein